MSVSDKVLKILLPIVIIGLSAILIIGRHFEASWAGGEGVKARSVIVVEAIDGGLGCVHIPVDPSRENVQTCAGQREKITFGSSTIWLDENTALIVTNNRISEESLSIRGGRIVSSGPVKITNRDTTFSSTGLMTIVDYSWLNRVDVLAIDGDAFVIQSALSITVPINSAMSFDTILPYEAPKMVEFNRDSASTIDFYNWASRR